MQDDYIFRRVKDEFDSFESNIERLVFEAASRIRRRKTLKGINTHLLKECYEISNNDFDKHIFRKHYELIWTQFKYIFREVDFNECPFSDDGLNHIFFVERTWEHFFVKELFSIINSNENIPIYIMKAIILLDEREKYLSLFEEFLFQRYRKYKV